MLYRSVTKWLLAIFAAVAIIPVAGASADSIALEIDQAVLPAHQTYWGGAEGYEFTVNSEIAVTALGKYGFNNTSVLDEGGHGDPRVAIWNVETQAKLAEVTIPDGTSLVSDGGGYAKVAFVALDSPLTLNPGTYMIAAEFFNVAGAEKTTRYILSSMPDPVITQGNGFYSANLAWEYPATDAENALGYFGPNFQYHVIPEPTTLIMLLTGIFGLVAFKCYRRK